MTTPTNAIAHDHAQDTEPLTGEALLGHLETVHDYGHERVVKVGVNFTPTQIEGMHTSEHALERLPHWHEHKQPCPDDRLAAHLLGEHSADQGSIGAWPDVKRQTIHDHLHAYRGRTNLTDHLVSGHGQDWHEMADHSARHRSGVHAALHATGFLHDGAYEARFAAEAAVAEQTPFQDTFGTPTLTNAQSDEVDHSHEGYWPRSEEARFHLVHAHGYTPVQAFSLTLTQAELDHHTEHNRPARGWADVLRDRDTHPVKALSAKRAVQPGPSLNAKQAEGVNEVVRTCIDFLRTFEQSLDGVWVLLDRAGVNELAGELEDILANGKDEQYVAAVPLADRIRDLLGPTS